MKGFEDIDITVSKILNEADCALELSILMAETSGSSLFLGGPNRDSIESVVFASTNVVPSGVLHSWDVSEDQNGSVMAWYTDIDNNSLYEVTIGWKGKVYANENSSYLFYNMTNVQTINLTNFDTSKAVNMSRMFENVQNLTTLDLSNFNTSNVTNMRRMFFCFPGPGCIANLNLSSFDTSNVVDMRQMFDGSKNLTYLDLSSFDTSKVIDMTQMFAAASGINHLDFRNATFDLVTDYSYMFTGTKNGINILTKNEATKSWLEARLSENGPTGNVSIP